MRSLELVAYSFRVNATFIVNVRSSVTETIRAEQLSTCTVSFPLVPATLACVDQFLAT